MKIVIGGSGESQTGKFEEFSARYKEAAELLQAVRGMVLSLGPDIVEDVRMHRIVYGRGAVLRMFLDVQPRGTGLTAAVRLLPKSRGAKEGMGAPTQGLSTLSITSREDLPGLLDLLREAYRSV